MNEMLKRHEGFSPTVYLCTSGKRTIGYGFNLDAGMSEEEASLLLNHRVNKIKDYLPYKLSFWNDLTEGRKDVLVNMTYNIGLEGLLKFKETLRLIALKDYEGASIQMLKSKWATQVGKRAKELAEIMKSGQ